MHLYTHPNTQNIDNVEKEGGNQVKKQGKIYGRHHCFRHFFTRNK